MMLEEYLNLEDREVVEFERTISQLLSKTFILRYKYDRKQKITIRNPQYSFIERHYDLFYEYLKLSGYNIIKDTNHGVMQLTNKYNYNIKRFDKLTTLVTYGLRLIYSEEREKISLRSEVVTIISYIVEKLRNIDIFDKKPGNKAWDDIFILLKSYNLIDKIEGGWNDPETQIIIYPSILFLITDDKINSISDFIKQRKGLLSEMDEEELDDDLDSEEVGYIVNNI